MVRPEDSGPLIAEFRPRAAGKWATIAFFGPLGLFGLVLAIGCPVALVALNGVPRDPALLAAAFGLVMAVVGGWLVVRSWQWLGHTVEIRRGGVVRR